MLVAQFMTPNVITIGPDTRAYDARQMMATHGIRRLPVMDDDRLVGIVTRRDIGTAPVNSPVRRLMQAPVITVPPTTPMATAALLMERNHFGALPVMEDDWLVGIISESDILRAFTRLLGGAPHMLVLSLRDNAATRQRLGAVVEHPKFHAMHLTPDEHEICVVLCDVSSFEEATSIVTQLQRDCFGVKVDTFSLTEDPRQTVLNGG